MLQAGENIGRYIVKRKLAEGGMAEIFLCTQQGPEGFEKEVVIKRIKAFLSTDPSFIEMFKAEARLASRLNHANVVQIFDFAKHEDTWFIAMEYIDGVSLWDVRKRVRERSITFSPTLAAEIGANVARGLHYAHSLSDRGQPLTIVHRDVTPHNVLLSYEGAIKLTDFGIAKAGTSFTQPGMLKGKFAYMSPEQARGDKVDARTDIFALGIVVWELVTGAKLFEGESDLAVLRAVQESVIAPPSRLNPDIPPELNDVILKALSRDVEARYQTAQDFERALAGFVLRAAKQVDDTSVAAFLAQLYHDEIAAQRAEDSQLSLPPQVGPVPVANPLAQTVERDRVADGTIRVEPTQATPTPSAPEPKRTGFLKPSTELQPGVKPSRRSLPSLAPSPLEEERASAPTENFHPTQTLETRPPQSLAPWVLGLLVVAAGATLGWALFAKAKVEAPTQNAVVLHAENIPEAAAPVVVAAPPSAEPKLDAPPVEPAKTVEEKPAPVAGVLLVEAVPWANLYINNRKFGEVVGQRRLTLPPGTYGLRFEHPKRIETMSATVSTRKNTSVSFHALGAP